MYNCHPHVQVSFCSWNLPIVILTAAYPSPGDSAPKFQLKFFFCFLSLSRLSSMYSSNDAKCKSLQGSITTLQSPQTACCISPNCPYNNY